MCVGGGGVRRSERKADVPLLHFSDFRLKALAQAALQLLETGVAVVGELLQLALSGDLFSLEGLSWRELLIPIQRGYHLCCDVFN